MEIPDQKEGCQVFSLFLKRVFLSRSTRVQIPLNKLLKSYNPIFMKNSQITSKSSQILGK